MLVEVVAVGGQCMLLQTRRFCCCARRCSLERWSYELSARDVGPGGMLNCVVRWWAGWCHLGRRVTKRDEVGVGTRDEDVAERAT